MNVAAEGGCDAQDGMAVMDRLVPLLCMHATVERSTVHMLSAHIECTWPAQHAERSMMLRMYVQLSSFSPAHLQAANFLELAKKTEPGSGFKVHRPVRISVLQCLSSCAVPLSITMCDAGGTRHAADSTDHVVRCHCRAAASTVSFPTSCARS